MRREKGGMTEKSIPYPGSPPHAQGKEDPFTGDCSQSRITPACAGKRHFQNSDNGYP